MGTFYIQKPELSYIHIPRTGMGMKYIIRDYLKNYYNVIDEELWMINHPNLKMVREHYPTGMTLSVVRNPWQRIWSFYKKISTEGYWLDWNNQQLMDLKPFNEWLIDYGNPEVVFNFPRWFTRFTEMVDFISYEKNTVDFICKAENLEEDFKIVQTYLNATAPLPNISYTYNHYEYREYYTSEGAEIVRKIHSRDCDIFKYVF
jgi:hypothetical protein